MTVGGSYRGYNATVGGPSGVEADRVDAVWRVLRFDLYMWCRFYGVMRPLVLDGTDNGRGDESQMFASRFSLNAQACSMQRCPDRNGCFKCP